MVRDPMKGVSRPQATSLSTVLIPVQAQDGAGFVFEITRKMWVEMRDAVDYEFRRIDHEAETAAAMLAIDRHERVV